MCPGCPAPSLPRLASRRPGVIWAWPEPRRWSAILPCLFGAVANDLGVDSTAHTVHQLGIDLGGHVTVVNGRLVQISDGSRLDDVADDVLLDALVLGYTAGTVGTPYVADMAPTMLRSPTVSSLLGHVSLSNQPH